MRPKLGNVIKLAAKEEPAESNGIQKELIREKGSKADGSSSVKKGYRKSQRAEA